jgi:glycosyltransferase involved in cell wall biosynthesis
MRIALIHYWLVSWRGGEKVLKAIADLYPTADIFAHVVDPELASREFPGRTIQTTFINRLPFARRAYQQYLPLMPMALEQLDLQSYDLVISSESGPAKGVIVAPTAVHVCYCHSPMRYVWDRSADYRRSSGALTRALMMPALHYVRLWDQLAAQRVDHYVANSRFVAQRIGKYYRREARVIHPPVAVETLALSPKCEDFYLSVGQLVPYKRPDLMIEAFNASGRPLVVIGSGEMLASLRRQAKPNVRLLGWQSDEVIREHYARCRALIFPGVEDFGLVPVEAMACGKPVIALGAGGVLETVVDGVTGVLFSQATPASLEQALIRFERHSASFNPEVIRAHALQFSTALFKTRFEAFVREALTARADASARGAQASAAAADGATARTLRK